MSLMTRAPQKGGGGDGVVPGDRLNVGGVEAPGFYGGFALLAALLGTLALFLHDDRHLAAGDAVHGVEAFEGVFAVEKRTLIEVGEVLFRVFAGEGCAAEEHGDFHALGVELLEAPHRPVPVEEPAQQRRRGMDLVDMGLRFGAHRQTFVS